VSSHYSDPQQIEIEKALLLADQGFQQYRNLSGTRRGQFLRNIAQELEAKKSNLITVAQEETSLGIHRLEIEFKRTLSEITLFVDLAESNKTGFSRRSIEEEVKDIPIGPVVVIGASNFPFAISVVGTDTISALSVGCTVVVKAHPAHPHTCQLLGDIVKKACKKTEMPNGTFQIIHGQCHTIAQSIVAQPKTSGVAFTGSLTGGTALYKIASNRTEPIPFHAEMGSLNPVFALPNKLSEESSELALNFLEAVTLFAGQMCTKPGAFFLINSSENSSFLECLQDAVPSANVPPMLNQGVYENYENCITKLKQEITLFASNEGSESEIKNPAYCRIFELDSAQFIKSSNLRTEAFGPACLLIRCKNEDNMLQCIETLEGSLTGSLHASKSDHHLANKVYHKLELKVGRLIWNGFPPGVIPGVATHHGGPWPACTNSSYTSIGIEAYKRFIRPLHKKGFPD